MTIIEAINSGKRFRLSGHKDKETGWMKWDPYASVSMVHITLDCWETEEKKIEISRGQLIEAFGRAYCHDINRGKEVDGTLVMAIAKELGF